MFDNSASMRFNAVQAKEEWKSLTTVSNQGPTAG
jgi:hypothetical protein